MMNQKFTSSNPCGKCAASSLAGVISTETRIEQVYNRFMEVANDELLPDLILIGGEDVLEDIYQETAVIVMELLSRLPAGVIPSQNDIYVAAEEYLREWIKSQVAQRCGCGFSYSELVKLAGLDEEDCDNGWNGNVTRARFGTIHTIYLNNHGGSIFLRF